MVLLFSTLFGFCVGSFANAFLYREKNQEKISKGRSACPNCKHTLSLLDLVPVFSWIFLRAKCRYCSKKISARYPLVELLFGFSFFLLAFFLLPHSLAQLFLLSTSEIFYFFLASFLVSVLLISSLYDLFYLESFDKVLIFSFFVFFILSFTDFVTTTFFSGLFGAFLLYTFFYLQVLLPGFSYGLKKKYYKAIGKLLLSYFVFPVWFFLRVFFSEKFLEKFSLFRDYEGPELPAWVGAGDFRFAFLMGFVLGRKLSILALGLSYLVGAVFSVFLLIAALFTKKIKRELPFIPFLSTGTLLAFFFGEEILEIYFSLFLF